MLVPVLNATLCEQLGQRQHGEAEAAGGRRHERHLPDRLVADKDVDATGKLEELPRRLHQQLVVPPRPGPVLVSSLAVPELALRDAVGAAAPPPDRPAGPRGRVFGLGNNHAVAVECVDPAAHKTAELLSGGDGLARR